MPYLNRVKYITQCALCTVRLAQDWGDTNVGIWLRMLPPLSVMAGGGGGGGGGNNVILTAVAFDSASQSKNIP
jgi:hypothetical protein